MECALFGGAVPLGRAPMKESAGLTSESSGALSLAKPSFNPKDHENEQGEFERLESEPVIAPRPRIDEESAQSSNEK